MLYQEASLMFEEGVEMDKTDIPILNQYTRRLDWFAVDLEGEHSAMDGQILEEHTEYVVYAIDRVSTLISYLLSGLRQHHFSNLKRIYKYAPMFFPKLVISLCFCL